MMNPQDLATFSITVALPNYLKSLVERMLQSVLHEAAAGGLQWQISNTAEADVTMRLPGDGSQHISPNLLAEVRRRDGQIERITIEGPWRNGALAAALERIGRLLQAQPRIAPDSVEMAWQWLRRWEQLRNSGAELLELRLNNELVLLLDARSFSAYAAPRSAALDPDALIQRLARENWSLTASGFTARPRSTAQSIKPLLWRLGQHAGQRGPLPGVAAQRTLRLKGWPYLAAGGHKSYAELIQQLRSGSGSHAALQALGLAPRSVVDGFLNACLVCEFFHDAAFATGPVAVASALPAGMPPIANQSAVIASIRRSLHGPRA